MNPGSSGIYCPTVEFTTESGESVRFESEYGTMPASHTVGETVKVFYDPRNPKAAEIESALATWLVPGLWMFFAFLTFIFSFLFFVFHFLMALKS